MVCDLEQEMTVKVKAKDVLNGQSFAWMDCPWCGFNVFSETWNGDPNVVGYRCLRCGQVTEIDYTVSRWQRYLNKALILLYKVLR